MLNFQLSETFITLFKMILKYNYQITIIYNIKIKDLEKMNTTKSTLLIACILLLINCVFCQSENSLQAIKADTMQELCAAFPNGLKIIKQKQSEFQQIMRIAESTPFKILMRLLTPFFVKILNNLISKIDITPLISQTISKVVQLVPKQVIKDYILYISPFAICLVFLLLTCSFAACCICCPTTCPPCRRLRKPLGNQYSLCELVWPGIMLILTFALILASGVMGLSAHRDVQTAVEEVGCSVQIVMKDFTDGSNSNKQNDEFIGVNKFSNYLQILQNSVNNQIQNSFINISSALVDSAASCDIAKTSIDEVPNPIGQGNRKNDFNYGAPFDGTSEWVNLSSTFPSELGSTNEMDLQSPIYKAYNGLQQIQDQLNNISQIYKKVKDTSIQNRSLIIQQLKQILKNITFTANSSKLAMNSVFTEMSPYVNTVTTSSKVFFGFLVAFASIGIICTVLLMSINMYKCRYLLYSVCSLLVIIGIVCLSISLAASLILPLFYYTCHFTTNTLSDATLFNQNIGALISESYEDFASIVTNCLPGQTRNFLQTSTFGAGGVYLMNVQNLLLNIKAFNSSKINSQIDMLWEPVKNMVDDTYLGKRFDFISGDEEASLRKISDSNNYPQCNGNINFNLDSWVPYAQGATIPCYGNRTNNALCINQEQLKNPGTSLCYGCISASLIFKNFGDGTISDLITRYNGCSQNFINHLSAIYTRYYQIKQQEIYPVVQRAAIANEKILAYKANITNVDNSFAIIHSSIQTSNSITESLQGLNCAILGQDISTINQVVCTRGLRLLTFIRLVFGLTGFGVLFTMYFASCTGVRFYKQQQAKTKQDQFITENNQQVPDNSQNNSYNENLSAFLGNQKLKKSLRQNLTQAVQMEMDSIYQQ